MVPANITYLKEGEVKLFYKSNPTFHSKTNDTTCHVDLPRISFFIVIQLQLSAFSPPLSSHPSQNPLPPPPPPSPLILSMCPLE